MGSQSQDIRANSGASGIKAIVIVILALLLAGGGLGYWKHLKSQSGGWSGGGPVPVKAVVAASTEVRKKSEFPGEVSAVQQVMLTSEVSGKVVEISFTAGQKVKAGDLLVRLDSSVEQADLKSAEARANFAQQQLKRAKDLVPTKALTEEVLQQRQAEYEQSQAALSQLKARILQKSIRAPFDGVLGLRQVNLGQYVNPGDVAATLTNTDEMFVAFDIPQNMLASIQSGDVIQVHGSNHDIRSFTARINAIEPQVNSDTRNVRIQAQFNNTGPGLLPGMYVRATLELGTTGHQVVLPGSAVLTSAYGDTAVVVKNTDNENTGDAEYVPVQVLDRIGNSVVVSQGISAGDIVITEGQLRVQPGSRVVVDFDVPQSSDAVAVEDK